MSKYVQSVDKDTRIDDILDFKKYGKYLYKPQKWRGIQCDDTILWDSILYNGEFTMDCKIGFEIPLEARKTIVNLIQANLDYFTERRSYRPILGYEFLIDTGNSKLVCCPQPRYYVHESQAIVEQL